MSFWSSLFGGQNKTLSGDINQLGQVGGWGVGLGENNLSQASQFYSSLLSGDPAKIGKVLAPEIKGIQGQKQQQLNSNAIFNNRSGGTNASNQQAGDTARSSINDLTSSLLGSSASGLAGIGTSALSAGTSALNNQADLSQTQMQNWANSILGLGTTATSGAGLGFLLGKI